MRTGDAVKDLGLVASGSVNVVVSSYWGQRHIFGQIGRRYIFGFNYALVPVRDLTGDVAAAEDTAVLMLGIGKLLAADPHGCPYHRLLIHNLLRILVVKNLNLSDRMRHTAPRSIRDRLLSYLSEQAREHDGPRFAIPFFSHQQLVWTTSAWTAAPCPGTEPHAKERAPELPEKRIHAERRGGECLNEFKHGYGLTREDTMRDRPRSIAVAEMRAECLMLLLQ